MATSREEELIAMTKAFMAAWNAHDLEGALAYCTEDVVFRMGPSPFTDIARGKQQVKSFLVGILAGFHVEIWPQQVLEEERVIFVYSHTWEHFRNMVVDPVEGTAEAAFEVDKVKSFTGTVTSETMEKLWAALEYM